MWANSQRHETLHDMHKYLPQRQWLHFSEIPGWTDYLEACYKRTPIKTTGLLLKTVRICIYRHGWLKCEDFLNLYLLVKRKSSKAFASSGHMVSNFPDEACWRATGNPMDNTLSRDETASFQVLSDGQAYFKPKGILNVLQGKRKNKERAITDHENETKSQRLQGKIYRTNWSTLKAFHLLFYSREFWIHSVNITAVFKDIFVYLAVIHVSFYKSRKHNKSCFWPSPFREKMCSPGLRFGFVGTLLTVPWQTNSLQFKVFYKPT